MASATASFRVTEAVPQLFLKAPKADEAVQFYKAAFGAVEVHRHLHPKRKTEQDLPYIAEARLKLGSSTLIVSDNVNSSGEPVAVNMEGASSFCIEILISSNLEAAIASAVKAGAVVEGDVAEEPYRPGVRVGKLKDPFGYNWRISNVSVEVKPSEPEEGKKCAGEVLRDAMKNKQGLIGELTFEAPGAVEGIKFYQDAFGAEEVSSRYYNPIHKSYIDFVIVKLGIGSIIVVISDSFNSSSGEPKKVCPESKSRRIIHLKTENLERDLERARKAGCGVGDVGEGDPLYPGFLMAKVIDPYGFIWVFRSTVRAPNPSTQVNGYFRLVHTTVTVPEQKPSDEIGVTGH